MAFFGVKCYFRTIFYETWTCKVSVDIKLTSALVRRAMFTKNVMKSDGKLCINGLFGSLFFKKGGCLNKNLHLKTLKRC